ncbi:MAG: amidohydrolase [Gemmatimonadetes bacterium]|nr:MAG: amidohydrolase [Gemmatimonadota bacterium]
MNKTASALTRTLSAALVAALLLASSTAQVSAQEKASWDVERELGPFVPLQFEATEGTWMNVDVSPDGSTIVFDLLGDLYTMPVEGGEATRITSGQAFDMQPRFSPDGSLIAFISDRDGMFNIWVVKPDGSEPRQVSDEDEREVNSPTWSPDGQYIFVRKHFVERRSLGAGAVWMYHVSGGRGVEVVERNGWQKDLGEPALSPDGRYLYYSRNVWPGQTFEYNKDPYQTIYAIRRVDLETGDEITVTQRPGGSITPRPSPDGRRLAFIRRVRLKTVLFLRDLETGEEWPVWDGLERDMQEAWAIHGVYTQYDWMPDARHIVIWAQGKIWNLDTETGEAAIIPFSAWVDHRIHRGLRFEQQVAPERFDVRMLRDVTTSPDGRFVVYSALGSLWVKELPTGAPRRLTRSEAIEFAPAFSPDGQWIAYATWSDRDKGRVRVMRADGTGGRDVVATPGHYTRPSFSPDGSQLVYERVSGDGIRGRTFATETGIYRVPVDGSAPPSRVTRSGSRPLFAGSGERIFLNRFSGGRLELISVDLDGSDEIVHFRSRNADQIVPSPDGRWVAFSERYRTYIAAFPRAGHPVDIGPSEKGYPVQRVSENAGAYLHWAPDSRSLHWSLGPEYFTRDLTETFTFVDGAGPEPAPAEAEGLEIGFQAPSDRPTGTVAFTHARIITVAGGAADGAVIEDGTLVVEGDRIVAVGRSRDVDVPDSAFVVDATGKTLIPGIIDVHAHVGGESNGILAQASWPLMANLAFGVTTAHDPSNNTETVFTNSEMIRAGRKLGPRLFSTGTILYGAEGNFKAIVNTRDDALKHLERMQAVGAFSVKSYNQRRRDARQMIIDAARQLGMMVVPEGGSLVYNNMTMVFDGHTSVEHSLPVPNVYRDVAELFGRSSTAYTPTMIVGYGGLSGEYYFYERTNVWENERLLTFTPRDVVDPRSRRRLKAAGDDDFNHVLISRGAKAIQDAGGLVTLGAHGQLQGLGAHWELWMFTQGGMTPAEAIRVATWNGARALGLDRDLGSLEVGKLADLVVLTANPLEDVHNTQTVEQVMVGGRLYDAATLDEIGNNPRPRPPLYWELEPQGPGGGAPRP